MSKVTFYTLYNRPPQEDVELDTETKFVSQAEADCSSLEYQLHRFGMDGLSARMEAMRDKFGYADCTVSNNFMELQQKVREATEYFEALPSEVRRRFNDRPEDFYEYLDKNPMDAQKDGYIPPSDVSVSEKTDNNADTTTETLNSSSEEE